MVDHLVILLHNAEAQLAESGTVHLTVTEPRPLVLPLMAAIMPYTTRELDETPYALYTR